MSPYPNTSSAPERVFYAVRSGAFCCVLLCHTLVFAQSPDPKQLLSAALQKLDATDLDADWSFTMEVVEEDELRIIQSNPAREKYARRQLLLVNGEEPDAKRLEEFREAEEKRIDDIDPDAAGYSYMVDVDTLQVLEQTPATLSLAFTPRIKALEDSRDALRATVLLNTQSGLIEVLEITNTDELSPAFSVTVDTYRMTLTFAPQQDENLLNTLESYAVGKAGFLKSFESLVTITFSDYERVPQ